RTTGSRRRPLLLGLSVNVGNAAMRRRPLRRMIQEVPNLFQDAFIEVIAFFGDLQHIPPRGEMMQLDVQAREVDLTLREDVVIEEDKAVIDLRACLPQRVAEIDLATSVGRKIFDEKRAPTFQEFAFDLCVAAEALRLLANVL